MTGVAETMRICEFDLFRQAYAAWHRCPPNDELVGTIFADYARDGVVPVWVSHYARSVLQTCKVVDTAHYPSVRPVR